MKKELLFIQHAVSMNFLEQSFVVDFFLENSFPSIPDNIEELLVAKGLLSREQANAIEKKIEVGEEEDEPENLTKSMSLSLTGGQIIDVPLYDENFEGVSVPPDFTTPQQEDSVDLFAGMTSAIDLDDNPITLDSLGNSEDILPSEASSQEMPKGVTISPEISVVGGQTILDAGLAEKSKAIPTEVTEALRQSTFHADEVSLEKSKVIPTEMTEALRQSTFRADDTASIEINQDFELGRAAVQKRMISVNDLRECIEEQSKMSHQGKSLPLYQLLLRKSLLTTDQLSLLQQEAQTRQGPGGFPEFGGERVVMEKYRLLEKLGSGGMGAVYKVEHILLQHNKFFAIKVMHPYFVDNEVNYKRFVREVEVAMGLVHKNIIAVREFGLLPNNAPYLVMDYSDGRPLDSLLKECPDMDFAERLNIISQMLDGLIEAHRCNVIHRDLKPANILVEKEEDGKEVVKIVDFGLAKLAEEAEELESLTVGVLGTPLYMSPEQASGEAVDRRADIYSVGIVLYEMITGVVPFKCRSLRQLLAKQLFEKPRPPREINEKIPEDLQEVIMMALEKDAGKRYQNANEFKQAVEACSAYHSEDVPKTVFPVANAKKKEKARVSVKSKVVLLAVLLLAAAAYYFWPQVRAILDRRPAPPSNKTSQGEYEKCLKTVQALKDEGLWEQAYSRLLQGKEYAVTPEENAKVKKLGKYLARRIKEDKDYRRVGEDVRLYLGRENYKRAQDRLKEHLALYPDSVYQKNIERQLASIEQSQNAKVREKSLQAQLLYEKKKRALLAMKQQKLWQDAYRAAIEIQKMELPDEKERGELKKIEAYLIEKLDESKKYLEISRKVEREKGHKAYDKAVALWKGFLSEYPNCDEKPAVKRDIQDLLDLVHNEQEEFEKVRKKEQARRLITGAGIDIQNEDYKEAIDKLSTAAGYQPKNKNIYAMLGTAHFRRKNYPKARENFEKARAILSGEQLYRLAKIYERDKKSAQAIESLQEAIDRLKLENDDERKFYCYRSLGSIYEGEKKKKYRKKAIACYQKAVSYLEKTGQGKKHRELYRKLGLLCHKYGNKQRAYEYLTTYRSLGGKDSRVNKILLEAADFTPLAYGKKWEYVNIIEDQKIRTVYEVAAVDGDKFMIKANGQLSEKWYRSGGYFLKEIDSPMGTSTEKALKYPVRKHAKWSSKQGKENWDYEIIATGKKVKVYAGTFDNCVKVVSREKSSGFEIHAYYAPNVGEVKQDRLENGQIVFRKELASYR